MIRSITGTWLTVAISAMAVFVDTLHAQRHMEALDRGVVAAVARACAALVYTRRDKLLQLIQ